MAGDADRVHDGQGALLVSTREGDQRARRHGREEGLLAETDRCEGPQRLY